MANGPQLTADPTKLQTWFALGMDEYAATCRRLTGGLQLTADATKLHCWITE